MQTATGPYLIRVPPGDKSRPRRFVFLLRTILLLLGLGCIGYYGYTIADRSIYQQYQNWAFEQQIAGRPSATFLDYLREQTPLAAVLRPALTSESTDEDAGSLLPTAQPTVRPTTGALLGRVAVPRLNIAAIVREGVDAGTLSRAVGHVPATALAGQVGNFAIAAHRDTLFRALKDIQNGDTVRFQSTNGTYTYQVFSTRIVKPSDVSVLKADGGSPGEHAGDRLLTMITCYPFYYVGSAPKRFIVQGRLVTPDSAPAPPQNAASPPVHPPHTHAVIRPHIASRIKPAEPHISRSSSALPKHKKHSFWRRIWS